MGSVRFEIIEYKIDSDGKEVVAATYEVESNELTRTFEQLENSVKSGAICGFTYTPV